MNEKLGATSSRSVHFRRAAQLGLAVGWGLCCATAACSTGGRVGPNTGALGGAAGASGSSESGGGGGGGGALGGSGGLAGSAGEPCYRPGEEVNSDPAFMGCSLKNWNYGREPDRPVTCTPAIPLPTSAAGAGAALVLGESSSVESGLEASAGDIQFSLARRASPVAVLSWSGVRYGFTPVQDDFQAGELLAVNAPGDTLPAFGGELPIPAHVQLTLPSRWVAVTSEPGSDAGTGDAGTGDAGEASNPGDAGNAAGNGWELLAESPTLFDWTSDADDGLLEIEFRSEFAPDAGVSVSHLFCRVALSAHHLEVPTWPWSPGFATSASGRARVVVTTETPNGIRLHAERLVAILPLAPWP